MALKLWTTPSFGDAPDPGSVNSCQSLDATGAAASPNPAGGSHLLDNQAEHWLCIDHAATRRNGNGITAMQPVVHLLCRVCRRIEVVLLACGHECTCVTRIYHCFASQYLFHN